MKRLISILLTTIMLLSAIIIVPTASAKEIRSGDYSYKLLDDGTISITKYYGKDKNLKLPEEIDGYKVTKISNYAFSPRVALFKKFDSVIISNSIVTIGRDAFLDCKIKAFRFGNNVRYISNTPLREGIVCDKITVPKNNKYFTSKSGVLFTKSMDKIMLYPQEKKGSSYTIPKGVKTTSTRTFYVNKYLKEVKFPKTLTSIGESAFAYSTRLEKVDFSGNLRNIGDRAFTDCEKLKNINIPKNIVKIGIAAFAGCENVEKINIDANKNLEIYKGAFAECKSVEKLIVPKVYEDWVFAYCGWLEKITIPANVKTIKAFEFFGCLELKTVTIPKTVTRIEEKAFGFTDDGYDGYEKIKGFTIKGKKGSTAHKYAKKNGFKFVSI